MLKHFIFKGATTLSLSTGNRIKKKKKKEEEFGKEPSAVTEVRSRELGVSLVTRTLRGRAGPRWILRGSETSTRCPFHSAQRRFAFLDECPGAATTSEAVGLGRG